MVKVPLCVLNQCQFIILLLAEVFRQYNSFKNLDECKNKQCDYSITLFVFVASGKHCAAQAPVNIQIKCEGMITL